MLDLATRFPRITRAVAITQGIEEVDAAAMVAKRDPAIAYAFAMRHYLKGIVLTTWHDRCYIAAYDRLAQGHATMASLERHWTGLVFTYCKLGENHGRKV